MKMFLWSQKAERIVLVSYPVKFLILSVSSLECFSELYWNHFSFREMFSKGSYRCLTAGKKITISTTLLSIHNMIIVIINLFCQVINISVCSGYGFTAFDFNPLQFDHMLHFFFNCSYRYTLLPTRIIEPSSHWAFICSKSTIETLEQGVKSFQS